jgi:hypothetical protein
MRAYTVGDPADPNIMVGPTVSQKQYERVESYIRKRIEEGTEVLVGGEGHPKGLEAGTMAPLCQAAGRWSFPYTCSLVPVSAVLTLAMAIGANAVVFSAINGLIL